MFDNGLQSVFSMQKDWGIRDDLMEAALRQNLFAFSAAKSIELSGAMRDMLTGQDGKLKSEADYKRDVLALNKDYNQNWLHAEYNAAVRGAQMTGHYLRSMDNDAVTLFTWHTSGDEKVCPICAPLDGICLPKEDDFWRTYWPQLHFRCNCNVIASGSAGHYDKLMSAGQASEQLKGVYIPKAFKHNPAADGLIFDSSMPVFENKDVNKYRAEQEYNLKPVQRMFEKAHEIPEYLDKQDWEHSFRERLKKYQAGEGVHFEVPAASKVKVTIDEGFSDHVKERMRTAKRKEDPERYKFMGEVSNILTAPDEVWATRYGKDLYYVFVKFYNGVAVRIGTVGIIGTNELKAVTLYQTVEGNDYSTLVDARKGALMYSK
jgi:SPP1 gp7 family putative phage head morphogenesis protein